MPTTIHRPAPPRRMYRLPEALAALGCKKSCLYERIADGLMPPPVKIGRVSAWPSDEIDTVQRAVIAGKSDDELRAIVGGLIRGRVGAMPPTARSA